MLKRATFNLLLIPAFTLRIGRSSLENKMSA